MKCLLHGPGPGQGQVLRQGLLHRRSPFLAHSYPMPPCHIWHFCFCIRGHSTWNLQQQCRLSSHKDNALYGHAHCAHQMRPIMPLWAIMSKASLTAISLCFRPPSALPKPPFVPPPSTHRTASNRCHCFLVSLAAPPASIEIKGYSHNSKVEVRENQDLQLKCIVANAKPAAQIVWYRGNVEYKPGKHNPWVIILNFY